MFVLCGRDIRFRPLSQTMSQLLILLMAERERSRRLLSLWLDEDLFP